MNTKSIFGGKYFPKSCGHSLKERELCPQGACSLRKRNYVPNEIWWVVSEWQRWHHVVDEWWKVSGWHWGRQAGEGTVASASWRKLGSLPRFLSQALKARRRRVGRPSSGVSNPSRRLGRPSWMGGFVLWKIRWKREGWAGFTKHLKALCAYR